jgi:DNA-binding MarR family transcriptional regulator
MDSFRLVTAVRRLHLAIRRHIVEEVRAAGFTDITASHVYVFQTPGPDGERPTELARRTLMTKQSMNHLLAGLERGGYLEREDGEHDGRARVLRLTAKGREVTAVIQRSSSAIEARWAREIGTGRLRDLIAGLEEIDALGVAPDEVPVER